LNNLQDATNPGVVNAICCATLVSLKASPNFFDQCLSIPQRQIFTESLLQAIADGSAFALSCIQSLLESLPSSIPEFYNEMNQVIYLCLKFNMTFFCK
jgi:hypothetical protein